MPCIWQRIYLLLYQLAATGSSFNQIVSQGALYLSMDIPPCLSASCDWIQFNQIVSQGALYLSKDKLVYQLAATGSGLNQIVSKVPCIYTPGKLFGGYTVFTSVRACIRSKGFVSLVSSRVIVGISSNLAIFSYIQDKNFKQKSKG